MESFAAEFGDKPMPPEKIEHPGDDHSRELAEVGQQIADLTAERFVQGVIRPHYDAMMTVLQREHARLSALPVGEPIIELVYTGKLLGDEWAALDLPGKGRLLRDIGLRVLSGKGDGGAVGIEWATAEGETDEGVFTSFPRPWAASQS